MSAGRDLALSKGVNVEKLQKYSFFMGSVLIGLVVAFAGPIGFIGIAIPHIRNPKQYPIALPSIIIGICKKGTDFNSFDGQETNIFFLVCADCEVVHLKIIFVHGQHSPILGVLKELLIFSQLFLFLFFLRLFRR